VLTGVLPAGALLARLRIVTRPAHDKLEGTLGLLDKRKRCGVAVLPG